MYFFLLVPVLSTLFIFIYIDMVLMISTQRTHTQMNSLCDQHRQFLVDHVWSGPRSPFEVSIVESHLEPVSSHFHVSHDLSSSVPCSS